MATSAVPDLIDALVTAARAALPAVQVYDGFGLTADPGDQYLMVGVDDPDTDNEAGAAWSEQVWANANHTSRDEEGHVVCAACGFDGASDPKVARDRAYEVVNAVENLTRANPSLGVATLLWTSCGTRIRLSQNQADNGAIAIVIFHINFRARI